MASYHFSAQFIGRSDGRSVVAASAYRSGEKIVRRETGDVQDYTRKGGVVWSEIMTPLDAPLWASDRSELWNNVEAKETRKNSQFAREINLALPHELTHEQNKKLLRDWINKELVSRGMCADFALHDPSGPDRHPNMHAHILTTTRSFDAGQLDGWSKNKPRDWADKETLNDLRESWARAQNEALEAAGFSERVDHRSLEVQKADAEARGDDLAVALLDRAPEPRLGLVVTGIERRAARAGASDAVTERGKELATARTARASLERAVQAVRDAVREVSARASASVLSVMQAAIRKHSPEEAREEPDGPDDGLPGLG